jgi:hypothetical protein
VEKLIVIGVFLLILWNLGSALYYMMVDKGNSGRMVRSLTWRVGLSVGLILALVLLNHLGIVKFHGIGR